MIDRLIDSLIPSLFTQFCKLFSFLLLVASLLLLIGRSYVQINYNNFCADSILSLSFLESKEVSATTEGAAWRGLTGNRNQPITYSILTYDYQTLPNC